MTGMCHKWIGDSQNAVRNLFKFLLKSASFIRRAVGLEKNQHGGNQGKYRINH